MKSKKTSKWQKIKFAIVLLGTLAIAIFFTIWTILNSVDSPDTVQTQTGNADGCSPIVDRSIPIEQLETLQLGNVPTTETGILQSGETVRYQFVARSGDNLNYHADENLCILIYDEKYRVIQENPLPEDGRYIIQLSTLQGSKTFALELSLTADIASQETILSSNSPSAAPNPTSESREIAQANGQTYFGHFAYEEISGNLVIVSSYGQGQYQRFEQLNEETALALMKMINTARDEGVWIVPVSGFRAISVQSELFENQIQRRGSVEEAALVSAPPGYSEHHTGYAIDLTDGHYPRTDITNEFENTEAYEWLRRNARDFGFELSFPPNNPQGVSFEPWHWRFIGSDRASEVFAAARHLYE